jgi:hypothetical protein
MTVREAILLALPAFSAHGRGGLFAVRTELERVGVPRRLAAEVVEFLPLAFARALLDGMGVRFDDHYVRQTSGGRVIGRKLLTEEPVFRQGLAMADEVSADGEVYMAVAGFSREYRAVNAELNAGARAEDLRCEPPVVFAEYDDERRFDDTSGGVQPWPRRWWQFWK